MDQYMSRFLNVIVWLASGKNKEGELIEKWIEKGLNTDFEVVEQ